MTDDEWRRSGQASIPRVALGTMLYLGRGRVTGAAGTSRNLLLELEVGKVAVESATVGDVAVGYELRTYHGCEHKKRWSARWLMIGYLPVVGRARYLWL